MTRMPLSLIDFCTVDPGESIGNSIARSVEIAQAAERLGYSRIWYAEHHNMPRISSSAPAVLIAHIGAQTSRIRLGAGGVMLPNHAPYIVAEQFGMLAEMYPGRIDLGIGRAPGTDMNTLRAVRRSPHAADSFPEDVRELQGYLSDDPHDAPIPGVRAIPGEGTQVPLYVLGSSLFGASLAAQLGLPYAFASHFAPTHLEGALSYYRNNYHPSERYPEPYAIAGLTMIGAPSREESEAELERVIRARVRAQVGRGQPVSEAQLDAFMNSHIGENVREMFRYSVLGTEEDLRRGCEEFAEKAGVQEIMVSLQATGHETRMRSLEMVASACGLSGLSRPESD
ncbi:LLM class flavin-dependent oxidoreductase [Corynebacterium uropygiale]|uniref:LLM class flavin-dependent oxidoreductase n=1 Tax=Corynebacterium uropygiale TaxID=1775911 RepID=A0A9X1TYS9_9CORY|nr:LLM class flavin-dependent oxidoreductase [Corynebacterium uropygiale]MCF4006171.1 LLM class flavin-dependent oxidoreductase [Corynebacterium uropygiale]